jgi:multiple sugar transport system substrate-binding protein
MASTRFSDGRNLTRRQFLKIAGIFGAAVSSSSLLAACGSDEGPGGGFEGVTLRFAVEVGPALGNPIKPYVKEWEQQTGATVEFVEVPFAEIFPKLMSAFQARADEYDVVIILPTWLGDMAGRGFLEPLDDRIEGNERVAWNDILPRCQDINVWEGQTYIVPLDCDVFMSFYNRQFLEDPEHQEAFQQEYGYPLAPPETWTQYRDIAEYFSKQGEGVFGVMESMTRKTQTFWTYLSRTVPYVSRGEGWELFFDPDDMTPLINSPGHVRALEDMVEIVKYGPPDILEFDVGDIRAQFPQGDAALALDWASIGMIPPDRTNQEVIGFQRIPGSNEVYNHETGEWTELDEPNRVPFMAANGWGAAIPVTSPEKDAAFDLISFLTSSETSIQLVSMRDNEESAVGYQPFRKSHFENIDAWTESGWKRNIAQQYLDQTHQSLEADFVQPDLRIPGAFEYLDALDAGVTSALAGQQSPQEALDEVAQEWDEITERLGREEQLKQYRASLGLEE